ncbi:MAG: hypothetical protein EPN82_03110 [Bacteroidetes bacterium]|nr:MAG: hypothetical protein EPN82_03110 [Bacteroidota bacterium]
MRIFMKITAFFFLVVLCIGCTVMSQRSDYDTPKTQLQTREFQTREYDTNDTKLIMKAVLNVLQDDGFIVKNAVVDLGLLSASKEIDLQNSGSKDEFWSTFFEILSKPSTRKGHTAEPTYNKVKIVEVSINVTEIGKRSKVRANFQAKILDNKGNTVQVSDVEDPKFYQDFFAKVDKGVFIQKQGL